VQRVAPAEEAVDFIQQLLVLLICMQIEQASTVQLAGQVRKLYTCSSSSQQAVHYTGSTPHPAAACAPHLQAHPESSTH
jgi:hypothetical protein